MQCIDLNSDLGESFGLYIAGNDADVLAHITSANVACGFHAGDAPTMRKTVAQAKALGVAVGAHPGFPDMQGFGRRPMKLSPDEVYDLVVYQIGALQGFTSAAGVPLCHVKPHGALYNMAAVDAVLASALCNAVLDVNPMLVLYGLANSELTRVAETLGLSVAHEVFADRSYQADGTLTPRENPGAMIEDPAVATKQILTMLSEGKVRSQQGTWVPIRADTICIHGDQPAAAEFAFKIRQALACEGVVIQAPRRSS